MSKKYNTIRYYEDNAKSYCEQTLYANLQENYDRFLKYLLPGSYILDFGCGSGRDSKYFIDMGYKVKAVDGAKNICTIASKYINQEVECMLFSELNDKNIYDGIWACSSLLHVEKEYLLDIICRLIDAVKVNGIIYMSFKIGTGYEINDCKYYNYLTKNEMISLLKKTGYHFEMIDYYETFSSVETNFNDKVWANFLVRKL